MTRQTPTLSVRIDFPDGSRFGPGKAALLRALIDNGSIKSAAAKLDMSYPRALKLIDQMNAAFAEALVVAQHGGATGGGASVTLRGQDVLKLYDQLCLSSVGANQDALNQIGKFCSE
ncbi:MAG: ModE family transcriptional regulator [Pseudomonadota bacterium]